MYDQVLVDYEGNAIKDGEKNLTVGIVLIRSLTTVEQKDAGEERFRRDQVARKILAGKELSLDEKTLAKQQVGKLWGPIVVGQVWPLLDETLKNEV